MFCFPVGITFVTDAVFDCTVRSVDSFGSCTLPTSSLPEPLTSVVTLPAALADDTDVRCVADWTVSNCIGVELA